MIRHLPRIFACLLIGALVAGCGGGGDASSSDGPPPPPPSGSLSNALSVQAADLGPLPANPDIVGRDGAYSGAFQGYSVWIYGDTFLQAPDASGRTYVSNSWSYTTDVNGPPTAARFEERLDSVGSLSMVLQETADEYSLDLAHYGDPTCQVQPCGEHWAIWPGAIITDPGSNHALIFYMVEWVDPTGNFTSQGSSVAIWQSFDQLPQRPTFNPEIVAGHPDLMFGPSEPSFGSAALISDGMLYVYGCGHTDDGLDKDCQLARVDPAMVQNKSAWSYFAGNGTWSASLSDAMPVFTGLDIMSVSWNNYLQRYVAVYDKLGTQDVVMRTAPAPEGPWSEELVLFHSLLNADGSDAYDAQAHAEFEANGGQTIYVTYSNGLPGGFASVIRVVQVNLGIVGQLP